MLSQKKTVHINSRDCEKPQNLSSRITLTLSNAITCSEEEEIFVDLLNCSIPFSFYNVNYSNKFLNVSESLGGPSSTFTIQLDEGNYNVLQFIAEVARLLNLHSALGFSYNVTYNKYRNKITIATTTLGATVSFLFHTGPDHIYDMQWLLGFYKPQDYTFTELVPLVSDSTANMSPLSTIFIHSNLGVVDSYESNQRNISTILAKVPINATPFNFIQYEPSRNIRSLSNLQTIQNVTLWLTDEAGFLLDLNQNEWYVSLEFTIVRKDDGRVFRLVRNEEMLNVEVAP